MKIILFISLLLVTTSSWAKVENIFEGQTEMAKPFELRDPFQTPKFKSERKKANDKRFNGVWNEEKKLTQKISMDKVEITGVLIGKERRVLIEFGGTTYKFKEDEVLGPGGPKIKAILPGGIILVEQITNIYGEAEYIETVIPISK